MAARFAIADNQNIVVKAGPYFAFGIEWKIEIYFSGEGYDALKDAVASSQVYLLMMTEEE